MTNINFDEPSEGHTNSLTKPALSIFSGRGVGIRATNSNNNTSPLVGINNPDPIVATPSKAVGVLGISTSKGSGVRGETNSNRHAEGVAAVVGVSSDLAPGGWFESRTGEGVRGVTHSDVNGAVVGVSAGLAPAGIFHGKVQVNGDVRVTGDVCLVNADCAEDFDIAESDNVKEGTVMVLNESGSLQPSYQEYDKKVAGIISGARGYKPAIILDKQKESQDRKNKNKVRLPIALMGKVYCNVDARHCPIEIGDLLTTSSTYGYAMKATDPLKSFGAVIGKALCPIGEGLGSIPVLVTLH